MFSAISSTYRRFRAPLLVSSLLLLGITQGCGKQPLSWDTLKAQIREEFPTVEHISITEFEQRLQTATPPETLIVDVRKPEEFSVSHLKHAVNIEDADVILELAEQQQAEQIIIYCSVGYRSAKMANELEQLGWEDVANLEGSMFEWANSGRPVFLGEKKAEAVHPFDPFWGQLLDRQYHSTGS